MNTSFSDNEIISLLDEVLDEPGTQRICNDQMAKQMLKFKDQNIIENEGSDDE